MLHDVPRSRIHVSVQYLRELRSILFKILHVAGMQLHPVDKLLVCSLAGAIERLCFKSVEDHGRWEISVP